MVAEYWLITHGYWKPGNPSGFTKVAECFDPFLQYGRNAPLAPRHLKKGVLGVEISPKNGFTLRQIKANMFTFSAALSACDKGSQWFLALELLEKSPRKRLDGRAYSLDGRAYCSALSACGKASQWSLALDLFRQSQGVVSWCLKRRGNLGNSWVKCSEGVAVLLI